MHPPHTRTLLGQYYVRLWKTFLDNAAYTLFLALDGIGRRENTVYDYAIDAFFLYNLAFLSDLLLVDIANQASVNYIYRLSTIPRKYLTPTKSLELTLQSSIEKGMMGTYKIFQILWPVESRCDASREGPAEPAPQTLVPWDCITCGKPNLFLTARWPPLPALLGPSPRVRL